MNYNLKNRTVKASPQAYERWIKGLERELREKLELMDKKRPLWPCRYIVSEVLGE